MADHPEILGVHIPSYKNLNDVWIPWSEGLALVGANGAGKTNILEALSLVIGSQETLARTRSRLDEESAPGLSIIVKNDPGSLPIGPGELSRFDLEGFGESTAQLRRDLSWWQQEHVSVGTDFVQAVSELPVSKAVLRTLLEASHKPLVQYTLESLTTRVPSGHTWVCDECEGPTEVDDDGNCGLCSSPAHHEELYSVTGERLYRRTLLTELPVDHLGDIYRSPAFSVLGSTCPGPTALKALPELPMTNRAPATLQWLPQSRSDKEVTSSLLRAFSTALGPAKRFVELLSERLPVTQQMVSADAHWWLHEVARSVAQAELTQTSPSLFVESHGGNDADWKVGVISGGSGERVVVGDTRERPLSKLSAGQRRWMDEALASAARALTQNASRLDLFCAVLDAVDDDAVFDAVISASDHVRDAETEGWWSSEAIDAVLAAIEPALVSAATSQLATHPTARALLRAVLPYYQQLDRQLLVKVVDEPEAHLHASAQPLVSAALQTLIDQGQNLVVATHSPAFLDLEGWQTLHVRDGAVVPVPGRSRNARSDLARDLGVTHGELLSGIAHILIVEGSHDQLVLEALYGSELRGARIAVVRMLGTKNLLSTVDLDFIERFIDVPITVMLDYTRTERVRQGKPITDEERKLAHLSRAARARGLKFDVIGLAKPDVVCYLSETAVRRVHNVFPGWKAVEARFEALGRRPPFKQWLFEQFGVDLGNAEKISEVLRIMAEDGLPPRGELARKINEFLASATNS